MKRLFLFLPLIILLVYCRSGSEKLPELSSFVPAPMVGVEQSVVTLGLDELAPDFSLPGVDGKYYSLDDFDQSQVLVIIFTCNHCPTAQAYEDRIKQISSDYGQSSVQLIAISPNSPIAVLPEELGYSDLDDRFEDMIQRAKDKSFVFPYLYDGDNQAVSLAYGPSATPQAFVFDMERKLKYVGRIDSYEKPGLGHGEDLRRAIDEVLASQTVTLPQTPTFGCSTKWSWKKEYKDRAENEWSLNPVNLSTIDESGVKELRRNESKKLRLINVWATWCGPCVREYPEFVTIQRMYGARDFEFISVSVDKASSHDKALLFLQSKSSALTNYRFDQDDIYLFIAALDSNWNGALPYTLLIEPGGNVVWSHQGDIDFHQLKRAIVDHPIIGRYY